MSLPPGTMLGPYEVLAPIEAGGMGSVYRGRDVRLARDVAVKVLPPGMVEDERAVERFLREARAAAALSHPNIVAIHDVGDAVVNVPGPFGGRETRVRFLVEEFVDGGSLRHRLKGGARPDLPTIAAWAAGLVRALAAAHEKGLVHRDLKPENVLVDAQGTAKIADFGLVRWIYPQSSAPDPGEEPARASTLTHAGFVVGTLGYMSPEQVRTGTVDGRSDLFGLGILLFELVTGASPFARPSTDAAFDAVLSYSPPSLTEIVPGVPERLARIVAWCLEKEPDARPASARELLPHVEQLQRELAASPRASVPGLPRLEADAGGRRGVPPLVWLGAAVAVLLAFAAGFAAGRARPERPPDPGASDAWTARPVPLDAPASTEVALLPGGRRALLGSGELLDAETGTLRPRALGGALAGPLVGRSGTAVLGTTEAGVVEAPLPAGTPVRTLVEGAAEPALSPDESLLAWVRREGTASELWVGSRDGSAPRRVARGEAVHWAWPVFSGDGERLVFYDVERSGPNAGTGLLFTVRLAEGTPLPFGPDLRVDPGGRPAVVADGSVLVRTWGTRGALLLEREGRAASALPFGAGLSVLASSPGGETVAARPGGGPLVLWKRASGPT